MKKVEAFDWQRLFIGDNEWMYFAEIGFRVLMIYLFAIFCLRIMGKRARKQLSPIEHVVIIALGSATGDALFYPEVPLLYAYLCILGLVFLSRCFTYLQWKFDKVGSFMSTDPRIVVKNGVVDSKVLEEEKMSLCKFHSLIRSKGYMNFNDIALAVIEIDGSLAIFNEKDLENGKNSVLYKELMKLNN